MRMMRSVDPASERVGAAVIRAWIEPGDQGALKVRITTVGDVEGASKTIGVASDIDVACAIIRTWLEGLSVSRASGDRRRAS